MEIILKPPSSPVAFSFLNFEIRWYGIIMAISMLVCVFCLYRYFKKRFDVKFADNFLDFSPVIIFVSLIGARVFYILGNLSFYIKNPTEILAFHHGGLSIWGALFFGIVIIYIISQKTNISFLKFADAFAVFMPLAQAIGRWGNYFNQEAYGQPSEGFLKLYVDIPYRYKGYSGFEYFHPAFLYESILDFILFLFLFYFSSKRKLKPGYLSCFYIFSYSLIRIVVESFRIDSVLNIFSVPVAVILSFLGIIFSFILFILIKNKKVM